jgi:hypothetical protein
VTSKEGPVKVVVWVVWRWTDWNELPFEILPTKEEADSEVARLNELVHKRDDTCYFVQPGRYYPDGRGVETGH